MGKESYVSESSLRYTRRQLVDSLNPDLLNYLESSKSGVKTLGCCALLAGVRGVQPRLYRALHLAVAGGVL